jgi:Zn-finger nucleic acid-binding protein
MTERGEARVLRCPSCGAPVASGDRLCSHCQAELATVRCASCFSLSFAGSKLCAQCGTVLGLEGTLGPTGVRCPRCLDVELIGMQIGPHPMAECLKCTGLFIEHAVLEHITRLSSSRQTLHLRPFSPEPAAPERTIYLLCPYCQVHMGRRNFGERSGVIVDVCAKHGVWFDRDELGRVVEFVESGGLTRMAERNRLRKLHADGRQVDPASLESYDMIASFLISLLRG